MTWGLTIQLAGRVKDLTAATQEAIAFIGMVRLQAV
jgi:hypothetical protein